MSEKSQTRGAARGRFSLVALISLALGRARQTSVLMTITMLGMLAAIVIVCVVPLFTSVAYTAGLRSMLASNDENADFEVNTDTLGLSTRVRDEVGGEFAALFQQNLGTTWQLTHLAQFSVISSNFVFASSPPTQVRNLLLYGTEMAQAAGHLGKLHGQWPEPAQAITQMDVAISTQTARTLSLKVGDEVPLFFSYYPKPPDFNTPNSLQRTRMALTVRITGIFDGDPTQAAYWHGSDFDPLENLTPDQRLSIAATMLIPNESLLFLADQLAARTQSDATLVGDPSFTLRWDYRLDLRQVSIDDLDAMITAVGNLQTAYLSSYSSNQGDSILNTSFPYLSTTSLTSPLFTQGQTTGILELFRQRVTLSRTATIVLTLEVMLLVLFFVTLMTSLLVDRQADTIALLRSRGASRGQIFAMLLTQGLLLGLLAFVLALPLSVVAVVLLARQDLGGADQGAVSSMVAHLSQVLQASALYGLAVLLVLLLAMGVQLYLAARMDVLAMRRQAARTLRRPLWQRLNLDLIAGVLALLSYGISFYLTSIGNVLQGDARVLIVQPLSVLSPFFLVVGGLLLFLRVFPWLLSQASRLAARGKGAVPMLALAQIARSPRQPLRMTLLLALATAFTCFTLIYSASQTYHLQQISTYMTGADFSGVPYVQVFPHDPAKVAQPYQRIGGVLSATAGYTASANAGKGAIPVVFQAVDSAAYTSTVIWPSQDEKETGSSLLARLVSLRPAKRAGDVLPIPALIDTVTAHNLLLHVNSLFPIRQDTLSAQTLQYRVVGIVPSIPTVNNRLETGVAGTPIPGAVLVDYATFATIYTREAQREKAQNALTRNDPTYSVDPPSLNMIWLHTQGDSGSLATVRAALTQPSTRLAKVTDRWQLLTNLSTDPLYQVLGGVLGIGTIAALLLALLGDLLASWLSARTRLLNFAIVRALGSTPAEVTGVMLWEQVIIYATGLLLGSGFGWVLASSMIPALTFTDLGTNVDTSQFYALQSAFPIQIVLPPGLLFGLLGLGVLCLLALALGVRVVSRPVLGQALRLNED